MDVKKLRYFLAVAEELSFSKVARRMGIGQPVLSRAIKDLEEKVGAELFERGAGLIRLTEAGEAFLPKVDEALMVLDEGIAAVREVSAKSELILDIGYLYSSYDSFVGDVLALFCESFPEIRIVPHPMPPGPMLKDLASGRLDVAFIGYTCREVEREFDLFHLWDEPLCIVVADHNPLAKGEHLALSQLASNPLISLTSESFPGRHELIMGVCRNAGVRPQKISRVDSLLGVLANVANSEAFSLMPLEVKSLATDRVKFFSLKSDLRYHALVRKGEARKAVLMLLQECRRIVQSRRQ